MLWKQLQSCDILPADLPAADWNRDWTLEQLEELLPNLLLPDPEPAQSADWDAACTELWAFVAAVVESGEGNKVQLYSRYSARCSEVLFWPVCQSVFP